MRYERPRGLLAGFHAEKPETDVAELWHIGEQWAPGSFFIREHAHKVWEFYLQISGESRWDAENRTPNAYNANAYNVGVHNAKSHNAKSHNANAHNANRDNAKARNVKSREHEASLRRVYTLRPGGFLAVAPGVRHRMHETPRARHHFFFAALDLDVVLARHDSLGSLWAPRETVWVENAESVLSPFRRLVREVSLDAPHRALGVRLALDTLVVEASRLMEEGRRATSFFSGHPAVARAREAMERQPNRPWTLNDLAREAGLSPSHLAERFTADVGVPPHRFLMQARIERARELLSGSEVAVGELALDLGFSSSQHFASAFKRLTGETATAYRARHAK